MSLPRHQCMEPPPSNARTNCLRTHSATDSRVHTRSHFYMRAYTALCIQASNLRSHRCVSVSFFLRSHSNRQLSSVETVNNSNWYEETLFPRVPALKNQKVLFQNYILRRNSESCPESELKAAYDDSGLFRVVQRTLRSAQKHRQSKQKCRIRR